MAHTAKALRAAIKVARVGVGLLPHLPAALWRRSLAPLAEGLCKSLERQGPAAIKLGQFLSVRPDLVGVEGAEIFERLRDSAPELGFAEIRGVVEAELRLPLEELFDEFDFAPVGSASVSQVHRARLSSGEEVAVKVQRPGVARAMHGELAAAQALARLAGRLFFGKGGGVDLGGFVERLREASVEELDFRREGAVAERFARVMAGEPNVEIPRVYWSHTTSKVLTTGFLRGHKISHAVARSTGDYEGLAELGARLFFRQIFEFGLFHADLHPSNVFITEAGSIGYLDFGLWGELDGDECDAVLGAMVGLLARDAEVALANLSLLGVEVAPERVGAFSEDVSRVMEEAMGPTLADTSAARIGAGLLGAVRRHGVRVPHKYALLIKALVTVEGAARGLHGEFDMEGAAREYLTRFAATRYGGAGAAELLWRMTSLIALGEASSCFRS